MTGFSNQSFASRHGAMGDESEAIFDELHNDRVHKPGLNRYWANGDKLYLNKMTPAMRYAPDRQTIDRYVECMGIGRDQTLKVKVEKMIALHAWMSIGPVDLFVWDSKNRRWWQAPLADWMSACSKADIGEFPEGKRYFSLNAQDFPCDPTDLEEAA